MLDRYLALGLMSLAIVAGAVAMNAPADFAYLWILKAIASSGLMLGGLIVMLAGPRTGP
jgi:hypothetical protein